MTGRLERLAEAVREASGIVLGRRQLGSLQSALSRVFPGVDAEGVLDAFEDSERAPGLLERVVDEVTVKESFFMREAAQLRAVDWPALLASARARGSDRIRVWSAACAGGEEPYTLAILASEAFGSQRPPVDVLATDISETALARARRGRFSTRAVRALDADMLDRHFDRDDSGVVVRRPLPEVVTFRRHNLAREPGPPLGEERFDLVVCRNVLIYFDAAAVRHALAALDSALHPGGVLLLGSADRLCVPRGRARSASQVAPRHGRRRQRTHHRGAGRTTARPAARPARGPGSSPAEPAAPPRSAESAPVEGLPDAGTGIEEAAAAARSALASDPLSGEAYFLRATVEFSMGDAEAAIGSLRAALYARPELAVAAFQLGRAYEAIGDRDAAARAYKQTLRTLDRDEEGHTGTLGDVDSGDLAYACGARIKALSRR